MVDKENLLESGPNVVSSCVNGLADQGGLHRCMPPSKWGEAKAVFALLQYRTLR